MSIETLREARNALKNRGVQANEKMGQEYLDLIMELRSKMNEAKVAALREAEKPFLDEIQAVEEDYAIFLKLAS